MADTAAKRVPRAVADAFEAIKDAATPANIEALVRWKDWTGRRLLAHASILQLDSVEEASELYLLVGDHIGNALDEGGSVDPAISSLHFALNQFCVAHKAEGWTIDVEPQPDEDDESEERKGA